VQLLGQRGQDPFGLRLVCGVGAGAGQQRLEPLELLTGAGLVGPGRAQLVEDLREPPSAPRSGGGSAA